MANPVTTELPSAEPPSAMKSTTAKTLRTLCVVLLIATSVVFGISMWLFWKVHDTVEIVRTNTAPAILEVLAAKEALVKADGAAIDSFQSGEVRLSGPGLQHRNQLTLANQSLVQVAEHNEAGQRASQRIQLLEGLIESYSGLIGQAHAHFETAIGTTDLWSASRLLHAGDSPIISELDELREDQSRALNDQVVASSTTTGIILIWLGPALFLFALLVFTQFFLQRRFRRAVNPSLLLATVLLVGLSIVTSLALVSQRQLEVSQETLDRVVQEWNADTSAVDARAQRELGLLVTTECIQQKGGCGPTIDRFITNSGTDGTAVDEGHDSRGPAWTNEVDRQTRSAASNARFWFLIPLGAILIVALIPLGLWPRIEEYRYRPR